MEIKKVPFSPITQKQISTQQRNLSLIFRLRYIPSFVISTSNKINIAGLKLEGWKSRPFLRNSLRWKKCFNSHLERKRRQLTLKKRWRATGGVESCNETTATDGPISTPSYFFFWAFSAAFVTLPLVTSLVVTLWNNSPSLQVQTLHTHSLSCTITIMQCLRIGGMMYIVQLKPQYYSHHNSTS